MDRRFLLFIVLSLLLLTTNAWWTARNAPPPQAAPKAGAPLKPEGAGEDADEDAAADDAKEVDDGEQDDAAGPDTDASDEDDAADAVATDEVAAGDDADAAEPEVAAAPELLTLGSVDPASPYRMLVTFTNEGAAVRRIELSSRRFLDLHDRGGYVGHLELKAGGGTGLLVQTVGAGTPAAEAGLTVGDRIVEAGATEKSMKAVAKAADFEKIIDAIKPNRELRLVIERAGAKQTLVAKLRRRPLEVVRPESENWQMRDEALPEDFKEPPSLLLTLQQIDDAEIGPSGKELRGVDLLRAPWQIVDRAEDSVTFERRLAALGLKVTKRFQLAKLEPAAVADRDAPAYHLTLTVTIENLGGGDEGAARAVAYRLEGPNGLPVEGWWYANKTSRSSGGLRDVLGRNHRAKKPVQHSAPATIKGGVEPFETDALAYLGVDSQYFAAALIPEKKSFDDEWVSSAQSVIVGPVPSERSGGAMLANITFRLTTETKNLEPGQSVSHSYKFYAGPKRPVLLAKYYAADDPAASLNEFVYYGWFGGVAQAMVGMLHIFYGWVGNYGVAIVMLTVLVRGCMFPVTRGQAKSMARMQELKPEMERIKEKFKGDQQKQAKAMQDLYRKHNVNPIAGCLPMLLQFPVFIGLYRGLAVDVELRQAPLFGQAIHWCSNLAAPDMFLDWSSFMPSFVTNGIGMFVLGPYLNLLPLVTIALFLLQQKLFMPPATDDQSAMQQKIMKYMMVFMGFVFYKSPSGLCLYFITSSLWGIAERKLVPPAKPLGLETAAAPPVVSGGAGRDKREKQAKRRK